MAGEARGIDEVRLVAELVDAQRGQLQRLRRGARAPVATLPFAFEDGPARIARLARALERSL